MPYTWEEFSDAVRNQLTVDKERMGIEDFLAAMIRHAVIDIQQDGMYRSGHEIRFANTNVVADGYASKGRMPEGAMVLDAYMQKTMGEIGKVSITNSGSGYTYANGSSSGGAGTGFELEFTVNDLGQIVEGEVTAGGEDFTSVPTITIAGDGTGGAATASLKVQTVPLVQYPWANRFNLIHHDECLNDGRFYISFSPHLDTFFIYPEIDVEHCVVMIWDGLKTDFADDDIVKFDEAMVRCVAEYVKGHLAREVNRNLQEYASYLAPGGGSYFRLKRKLFIDWQKRQQTNL